MGDEEGDQGLQVEEATDVQSQDQGDQQEEVNPLWNDLLETLPPVLHSQVTPHLKKWDQNYQNSLQKVHSEYESFKPFKEQNIPADQINYALQLMRAIESEPEQAVKALQAYLGTTETAPVTQTQEQGQVESDVPDELFQHPKFVELQNVVQTLTQQLQTQTQVQEQRAQQEREQQEYAQIESELKQLHETHGDFDERFILSLAAAQIPTNPNITLEQCVQAYKEHVQQILTESRRPNAPKVVGTGGLAPDNQIGKNDLKDSKNRKAIVAQMLQAASNQT
jgi:hypothetical protein